MSGHAGTAYPICQECGGDYVAEGMDVCLECAETVCVDCGRRRELDVFGQCPDCAGGA